MKKGISDFQDMKKEGKKVAWLTNCDFPTAK
jgi:ketopantoate hydroxymethyltransferase